MNNQNILSANKLESLREMVNGLSGINISRHDMTNEVVIKSLIVQKLNEIKNQYRKRGVELNFTHSVPASIISNIANAKNPIRELNRFLKNKVLKFLLSKSTLEKYKTDSKHIADLLY